MTKRITSAWSRRSEALLNDDPYFDDARAGLQAQLAATRSRYESTRANLHALRIERRTWRFRNGAIELTHNLISTLESDLRWQAQMLAVAKEAAFSDKARARWAEAIDAIAHAPKYAGHRWPSGNRLTPQIGLLPLGENPATGLWEFVHLQTGTEPKLGPDGRVQRNAEGRLTLTPETGMVFVLLPGGRVPQADSTDQGQQSWITEVDIDPFFLSKYEMTHEQWDRVSVRRGLPWNAETSLLPANNISWDDITAMLQGELGWCDFPSEAQWEYGCRAGTTTPWWPGNEAEELVGVANIEHEVETDTHVLRVGALRANAFGLHDVHGNVWEWCGDTWGLDSSPRPGDGLRDDGVEGSASRVARGGSWRERDWTAGASIRGGDTPERRNSDHGVRPSRRITP